MKQGTQSVRKRRAHLDPEWFLVTNPIDGYHFAVLVIAGRIAGTSSTFASFGEVWRARHGVFRVRRWKIVRMPKVSGTKSKPRSRK